MAAGGRRIAAASIALLTTAMAQPSRDPATVPVAELPRPGYEPKRIRIGNVVLAPTAELSLGYDSNIFASPDAIDDAIVSVGGQIAAERQVRALRLDGSLFGRIDRYKKNEQENSETFGIDLRAQHDPTARLGGVAHVRYERLIEQRSDPESNRDPLVPPSKINLWLAELTATQWIGRLGLTARGGREEIDYLSRDEADRDLTTWRAAFRGTFKADPRVGVFVEPFYNRRDVRVAVDRNGVDRDTRTIGVLTGVDVDLARGLKGELGVGVFRARPDDPSFRSFSGIAASGSIAWRPRVRTAITADVFRGDVATVRAGAIGRIDTRGSIRVDQEVRHNLIAHAEGGVRRTTYRGAIDAPFTTYSANVGATYLLSRHLAVTGDAVLAKRTATRPDERFERARFTIGLRYVY